MTGMSCAACSARVEKAVSKVPGVTSCSVSLLTNSMGVEGHARRRKLSSRQWKRRATALRESEGSRSDRKAAAAAAGEDMPEGQGDAGAEEATDRVSVFLVPLMYLSMGHMMWNWPLPAFLAENHVAMGLVQLLLTAHRHGDQPEVFYQRL